MCATPIEFGMADPLYEPVLELVTICLARATGQAAPRMARWPTRTRGLAALRRRDRTQTSPEVLLRQPACVGVLAIARPLDPSALGQQYQELKSERGFDHFEGRTYPGWQHHVVLTAVAHAYIQRERMRRGAAGLTFPAGRAIVQEIFTALLLAATPRYMHWMEQAKRELQRLAQSYRQR